MDAQSTPGYRRRRQEWTRAEILDAAWEIARRDGIAALSLREVAERVGLRTPSLYYYFSSKTALYDAMFAQGMEQFAVAVRASAIVGNARETLRNRAHSFVTAAVDDPTRFELLFHRPVPDFVPSPEPLQLGLTVLAETRELAQAAGIRTTAAFDLYMATMRGLIAMQIANEPSGDRWTRLVDEAVDILTNHYGKRRGSP
jgi:AcrR family transcriptional regulator